MRFKIARFVLFLSVLCFFGPRLIHAETGESDLRSKSVFVHYVLAVAANVSTHTVLIDLSDTSNWPNPTAQTGQVNVTGITVWVDKTAASTCTVKIGVVNAIDSSTGSVSYFFETPNERNVSNTNNLLTINTDNAFRCLKVIPPAPNAGVDGTTPYFLTSSKLSGSTIYQTDVNLPSPNGNTSPGLGDVVMNVANGTAAISVVVDILYHVGSR